MVSSAIFFGPTRYQISDMRPSRLPMDPAWIGGRRLRITGLAGVRISIREYPSVNLVLVEGQTTN